MNLQEHAARFRDMGPHVATLTRLASEATTIVELGVRTGVSTWALLDGLPEDGRLVSVDLMREGIPRRVTEDPRWTLVTGDDRDATVQAQLPNAELVFIDTSHEYHHTLEELDLACRIGAKRIALHDWNLADVEDAVHGFIRRHWTWRLWLVEPSEWGFVVLAQ